MTDQEQGGALPGGQQRGGRLDHDQGQDRAGDDQGREVGRRARRHRRRRGAAVGTVDSPQAAQRAIETALKVKGVGAVDSQLQYPTERVPSETYTATAGRCYAPPAPTYTPPSQTYAPPTAPPPTTAPPPKTKRRRAATEAPPGQAARYNGRVSYRDVEASLRRLRRAARRRARHGSAVRALPALRRAVDRDDALSRAPGGDADGAGARRAEVRKRRLAAQAARICRQLMDLAWIDSLQLDQCLEHGRVARSRRFEGGRVRSERPSRARS